MISGLSNPITLAITLAISRAIGRTASAAKLQAFRLLTNDNVSGKSHSARPNS